MSDRITWAVQTLAIDPADHILEIGCGHGVAVSMICDQLTTGTITDLLPNAPTVLHQALKPIPGVAIIV